MINFNFSDDSTKISIPSGPTRLKANTIHNVHVKSVDVVDMDTKNGKMKVLSVVFEDNDGLFYDDRIFEPRSQERKTGTNGKLNPSEYDLFMTKIRLYAKTFAPTLYKIMNDKKLPVTNSWEALITQLSKAFAEGVKAKTVFKLKILKNGSYPAIPRFFLKFNENGEMFISTKFISSIDEDLEFSEYELKKIKEEEALKPTTMTDIPVSDVVMDMTKGTASVTSTPISTAAPIPQAGGAQGDEWEKMLAGISQ